MILRVFIFFLFTGYVLFFTASFFGTGHANDGVSEDEGINYFKIKPAWFWNQPVNCGMTAVGMTMHSELAPEQSVKLAYEKSLAAYQRQQEIIYGNREPDEEGLAGSAWQGADHMAYYDTTGLENLKSSIIILDRQIAGGISMVLSGPAACSEKLEEHRFMTPVTHRPEWADNKPEEPGYLFAVGTSRAYEHTISSWEKAESEARKKLSGLLQRRALGMGRGDQDSGIELLYSDMNITLQNAVVLERYYDPDSDLYLVLMRMPDQQL